MIAAAINTVRLGRALGKDGTVRDVLAEQERKTGQRDARLDGAVIPRCCTDLWAFYGALAGTRPQAFSGVAPLSAADIEAGARLFGVELSPWEAETLLLLDAAVRAEIAALAEKQREDKS